MSNEHEFELNINDASETRIIGGEAATAAKTAGVRKAAASTDGEARSDEN